MKIFLIIWAIGLAACDKLDRTYLPPLGFQTSGGDRRDLGLPLEIPKENFPSTVDREIGVFTDDKLLETTNPNVALGIDRQGPSAGTVSFLTNTKETKSYDFIQTTPSVDEIYETTFGPVTTERYRSHSEFNSKYPGISTQYSEFQQSPQIFQNINVKQPSTDLTIDTSDFQTLNIPEFQQNQNADSDTPRSQSPNIHLIPSNIPLTSTPQDLFSANYPSTHKEDNVDKISEYIFPTATGPYPHYQNEYLVPDKPSKDNQVPLVNLQYSPSLTPGHFNGKNVHSTELHATGLGLPAKTVPFKYLEFMSSTPGAVISSEYASIPPERVQAEGDRNAIVLKYENTLTPEGFLYRYNTSNGIHAVENGTATGGVRAEGSYSYTGDDGKVYSINYTADENGFLPHGDHLPTAPPVPDAILKVIEQAIQDKHLGIVDDGSYDDSKYGHQRYQGPMQYIARNPMNTFNRKKLIQSEDIGNSKIISYEKGEEPVYSSKPLHKIHTANQSDITFKQPNADYTNNNLRNDYHFIEDHEKRIPNNVDEQNNRNLLDPGNTADNIGNNSPLNSYENDLKINNESNAKMGVKYFPNQYSLMNEKLPSNIDNFNSMAADKSYGGDTYQSSPTGYEYSPPQNIFNHDIERNDLDVPGHTEQRGKIKSEQLSNAAMTVEPNTAFNFKNPFADDTALNSYPLLPVQSQNNSENTFQSEISPFYNNGSKHSNHDQAVVVNRIFTTHKSEHEPPMSYEYQSRSSPQIVGNDREHHVPSSNFGLENSASMTSVPSSTTRTKLTGTGLNIKQSTPTSSQFTSTSRPPVASKRPEAITQIPSLRSDYKSGQESFSSIHTQPTSSVKKLIARPRVQNRLKTPGFFNQNEALSEQVPKNSSEDAIGVFTFQNRRNFSRPNQYRSSTEKLTGEDFSGPKQPQGFDPKHGYYY